MSAKSANGAGKGKNLLYTITDAVDEFLRQVDFAAQRTAGGLLDNGFTRIDRHTLPAVLWPSLIGGLIVLGTPSSGRAIPAAVVSIVTAMVLIAIMRRNSSRRTPINRDLLAQTVVVLLAAGGVGMVGSDRYDDSDIYVHLFVIIAASLALSLVAAALLAGPMCASLRKGSGYGSYLARTELFASRGAPPRVTALTFLTALVIALFRAPFALLTIPAIVTLVVSPLSIPMLPAIALAICFGGLFLIGLNERIGVMWTLINAVFFRGGAALVSAVIILLAAARIADVSYVTTIFDNAAGWSIGALFIGAYALSWWYDYWTNRLLAEEIMALVDPTAVGRPRVTYPIASSHVSTAVPATDRFIQIHGPSRVIALQETTDIPFFQTHDLVDFIYLLSQSGAPGGKAHPTALQVKGRVFNFHSTVAALLVVILGGFWWVIRSYEQQPEVTLQQSATAGISLEQLLTPPADDRPLILVAASGGGTRAAVYTAAVLEGLSTRGHAERVVVGSGVSGGGAALAYFAGHRPGLIAKDAAASWERYLDAMREPYIRDVIDRAFEWRIVAGGRLGMLLDESFKDRWRLPADRTKLNDVSDIGLIFNTSLAGHLERPTGRSGSLAAIERDDPTLTRSTLAGGRLVLTNLGLPAELTKRPLEPGTSLRLPVVVRSDQLALYDAAALNANFPPVFSNAAIDVDDTFRYWVTDGGAVDNRGLEMLLFAARHALVEMKKKGTALPRIHVVVADASAFSNAYSQDRGVGSLAGAGSRFASHLNAELVDEISRLYPDPDLFKLSYMMMPDRLREAGSFGTHWMLQARISVRVGESESVVLEGAEMVRVIRALHSPAQAATLSDDGCRVLRAVVDDPSHRNGWDEVTAALAVRLPAPACP